MVYSYGQLEQTWISAGGDPSQASMAAAIALAESGGNPNSVGHNTNGSLDRGLWQINTVHGAQSTLDPMANARAAVSISNNGRNWNPWVTYWKGSYKKYLQGGIPPAPGGTAGGTGSTVPAADPTPSDPLSGSFWQHTADVILNWIFYGGLVVVGGVLMAIGFVILFKETPAGATIGKVASAAGRVLPLAV